MAIDKKSVLERIASETEEKVTPKAEESEGGSCSKCGHPCPECNAEDEGEDDE